jgi:DNA-binding HxlR family transcriptional regulator
MGSSYYQFCPVAKAMELLDDRWTLLVSRELVAGGERFSELRRGLPRISTALLSKRLQQLARAGVVERSGRGQHVRYHLTPAGEELRPVVEALGAWGVRWVGELGDRDLDPKLLLWDMQRNVEVAALPPGQTVVQIRFTGRVGEGQTWWLCLAAGDVDVCDTDPGRPVDLMLTCALRTLTEIWRGDLDWAAARAAGSLTVEGARRLRDGLPNWFHRPFGAVPRPRTTERPQPIG